LGDTYGVNSKSFYNPVSCGDAGLKSLSYYVTIFGEHAFDLVVYGLKLFFFSFFYFFVKFYFEVRVELFKFIHKQKFQVITICFNSLISIIIFIILFGLILNSFYQPSTHLTQKYSSLPKIKISRLNVTKKNILNNISCLFDLRFTISRRSEHFGGQIS